LFRDSSIFLLPSYCENFPLVLLEAAASGMGIIASPVGAVPEMLEHEVSAIFVEAGNKRQIAQAIYRLVQLPEERVRFGRAARDRFIAQFERSRIMKAMESTYRHVLGSPRGRSQVA
jgi:glycosyltransferase involved in cell wall biosynthesis